jgi:hypothetical protein
MRLLGIYLNDHLVGATGGGELARRVARSSLIPPTPACCSGCRLVRQAADFLPPRDWRRLRPRVSGRRETRARSVPGLAYESQGARHDRELPASFYTAPPMG